jgi:hypothetical protein
VETEKAEFETSIGPVRMNVESPDWLAVETAGTFVELGKKEFAHLGRWPYVYVSLVREDGDWKLDTSKDYPFLHTDVDTEVPVPQSLIDELVTLGREWAKSHPEEFEQVRRKEFTDLVSATTDFTFEQILEGLRLGQDDLRSILEAPEFKHRASSQLVRRIKKESQRIRVMRLQIVGAARAIKTLAEKCVADEVAQPSQNT